MVFIIPLFALLLVGCSEQGQVIQNDEQLNFQRKIDCAKFIPQAKAEMKEKCDDYAEDRFCYLTEMFYEPTINSCVYVHNENYKGAGIGIAWFEMEVYATDYPQQKTFWQVTNIPFWRDQFDSSEKVMSWYKSFMDNEFNYNAFKKSLTVTREYNHYESY